MEVEDRKIDQADRACKDAQLAVRQAEVDLEKYQYQCMVAKRPHSAKRCTPRYVVMQQALDEAAAEEEEEEEEKDI